MLTKEHLNTVVAIEIKVNDSFRCIGTGFFVLKTINKLNYTFLVTNRHVIEQFDSLKEDKMYLRTYGLNHSDKIINNEINLKTLNQNLLFINKTESIDLAIICVNANILTTIDNLNLIDIDDFSYSSDELIKNQNFAGDLIYMIGYSLGITISSSLSPIVRQGCIARLDEKEIEETHNFLIDINNFPGNSGSPVYLKVESDALINTKSIIKPALIGMVYGYIPYQGNLYVKDTKINELYFNENSGLARVIPVEYIREGINSILLKNGAIKNERQK